MSWGEASPSPEAAAVGAGACLPRGRVPRRALHGVLLLDKPVGLSSQDALWRARRLLRAEKGGHTGTLDPLASGLLPLCFGAATKFAQAGLEADKTYLATLTLGQTRRGGDLEGEVLLERPVRFDEATLQAALARFTGRIRQVPPMHSALKHQGRALYAYAREGQEVVRTPREILIHRLDLLQATPERLVLEIHCSKGTYIRTLAEDLGEALGCGAHLAGLRRLATGRLRLEDAVTLSALEAMGEAEREALLRPPDALLNDRPALTLSEPEAARFLTGLRRPSPLPAAPSVRVYGPQPGSFLGLAHIAGGELIPDRLLNPEEVRALVARSNAP